MAITTLDGYIGSAKQKVIYTKTVARTTVAYGWFSLFDLGGQPGAGTLAGANTTSGVVQDDTIAGYPPVNAFGSSATGILSLIDYGNTVACRIAVYDRLWLGGAYAFNASTAVTQSSIASRVPSADYRNVELWIEQVTAGTGNQVVTVTYTNQDGTTGRSTPSYNIGAAATVGRCWQLPLQVGDSGIQSVTNIVGSTATAGTFNVMLVRPLWQARIKLANDGDVHDLLRTGAPQVYDNSALYVMVAPDSTSSGIPDLNFQVANG